MAAVLLVLGALAVVAGFTLWAWPAGLVALGALMVLAGIDLRR